MYSNMSWIILVYLIIGNPFFSIANFFGFFYCESIVFSLYKCFEVSYYSFGVDHRRWLG